jgi:hypothetical protein
MSITVTTVDGDVTLKEITDSYEEGIGGGGPWIREEYYCEDWDARYAVANAIMGVTTATVISDTISRSAPLQCPQSPNLWALDVGPIRGFGGFEINDGRPSYPAGAIIPVSFGRSPIPFEGADNTADPNNLHTPDGQAYPFCRFDLDTGTETYTIQGTEYMWYHASDASFRKKCGVDLLASVGVSTIVCTIMQVPFLPFARLITMKRQVNNATFLGHAAGYVLYENSRSSRTINSDGTYTQDLTLIFKVREFPWGTYLHPTPGVGFVKITTDGTSSGAGVHTAGDLTTLLYGVTL